MFRRQQFDRVNPRNVAPSRHTLFIRGLPGNTDVTKVKDFFSDETNSKCSVDFFSTSEDKKRLSVAIRFRSHDLAKDILAKYNNKHLMGFPVELSWFKDLKKARAKMFEEQRQSGGRAFQRQNFRGNFRGNDRRAMGNSPNGFFEGDRRMRAGSSSSDGAGMGTTGRPRYSNSRSRSFTGSSSRTGSPSGRSVSGSPRIRRNYQQNVPGNLRADGRGFPDEQPGSFVDRQPPRNQSYRSMSRSSSSSRSSQGMQVRNNSAVRSSSTQKAQPTRYQQAHGTASPLNFASRRGQRISGSPMETAPDYSFSNAPGPGGDGGSSLVSGLIQLKRRNQPDINESRLPRRKRRNSVGSSSSGLSAPLDASASVGRVIVDNRLSSLSPPFAGSGHSRKGAVTSVQAKSEIQSDLPKRKRQKRGSESPDPLSPPTIRGSYVGSSKQPVLLDRQAGSRNSRQIASKLNRGAELDTQLQQSTDDSRILGSEDEKFDGAGGWPQSSRRTTETVRRSAKPVPESLTGDSSYSEVEEYPSRRRKGARSVTKGEDVENESKAEAPMDILDDPIELIRQRKETLAQDYKRDCEAFTTVVRTLISKDIELEGRLMPMLKEILHERGQRCIEELRTFIANHQTELEKTEGAEVPVS